MSITNNTIIVIIAIIFIYFVLTMFKLDGAEIKIDYNCDDFYTQQEAQKVFEQNEKDIYRLDQNKDFIACNSLIR